MYTRGRVEWTHGDVFSSVKQVILHFSSILTGCWVHLLSPIFCLPKFAHMWVITCFRGSPKKPLDLTYFENGTRTTHSMYCPTRRSIICPLQKTHHTKLEGPRTKEHHDNDIPPNHPTNNEQRAHDMTRLHTTNKHKNTHVHSHACIYTCLVHVNAFVYVCVRI